jgi:hypothetical protein
MLPTGLISNHYEAKDWDLFKIPEVDKALYEYDGQTELVISLAPPLSVYDFGAKS